MNLKVRHAGPVLQLMQLMQKFVLQTKKIIIGDYWRWQELLQSTHLQVQCTQYINFSTWYCQLYKIARYLYVKLWSEIIPDIVINEGFRHILCELAPDFLYWFILWLTSSISVLTVKISRTRQYRHQLRQNKLVPINLIFTVSSMHTYIHKHLSQCITIARGKMT